MKIYTRYFALSLLMFSSALCHAALQNGKIQVSIIKGESSLINPQSIKEPVVKGKLFEQGYKVETKKDSTVELCLSNGSTILVNPETLVEIRTFRQVASNLIVEGAYQQLDKEPSPSVVEIFVVKGKIIGEARKLNPQSSFTIKSPAGVARIRGTVYSLEYSRNETSRTGNMEVSCVRGSVEVTVNGSDNGPQAVLPGKKMNAQTPLMDSPEESKPVPAVAVKVAVPAALANSPEVNLASTEGLVVGSEVKAPGVPSGVKVVSIENGKVTFSEPITLPAGTEIVIDPPAGATYVPSNNEVSTVKDKAKAQVVSEAVIGKKVVKMDDVTGLRPGMKITYVQTDLDPSRKGVTTVFPDDVTIVSVDAVNNTVTLSTQVTVNAKVKFIPVYEPLPPAPITNPVITFSNLGPDELKSTADDLSKGTSLPTEIKEQDKDEKPSTPPADPSNTGGVKDVMDNLNKKIQETIERDNQKNPSPTGG